MTIPADILVKMEDLTEDKLNIVFSVVNHLAKTPQQILAELREEGLEHAMTDDEIDDFVNSVRRERSAAGC